MTRNTTFRTRFAPSTTGPAHPGTLLSALLCWLAARHRNGQVRLRLDDLDPERCSPAKADMLIEQLAWFGLDWDGVDYQSEHLSAYAAALDRLAADGRIYPCSCSRRQIKQRSHRGPDGGFAYDNACRNRPLPTAGWRTVREPLRLWLPDTPVTYTDRSGRDLSQFPAQALGDPIVRRRDGAIAYHLATVVDDGQAGMTNLIRGHDLATSAATQLQIMQLLGYDAPEFRHHLLLLEPHGDKLAKLHGSVNAETLRKCYTAEQLCGLLAYVIGLVNRNNAISPTDLITEFNWDNVVTRDQVLAWNGQQLQWIQPDQATPTR